MNNKELANAVKERLEKIAVATQQSKNNNPLWQAIKNILKTHGYWKNRPRGKPPAKGTNPFIATHD